MKVDIVYTWVNGNDPNWRAKKAECLKNEQNEISSFSSSDARFQDNQELKYSLRSIYKYAPWVNKIYIVTDNQVPDWFNTDNKWVEIIDHKDIFEDHSCLPTFNSMAIETKLHRIEGLSEQFLYFNDDVFLGRKCAPTDFFSENNIPHLFVSKLFHTESKNAHIKKAKVWRTRNEHQASIENCRELIFNQHNQYIKYKFRHGVKAFNKSVLFELTKKYKEQLNRTSRHKFRKNEDVLIHALYSFYALANKKGIAKYSPLLRLKMDIIKKMKVNKSKFVYSYISLSDTDLKLRLELIKKYNPLMFCLNQYEGTPNENLEITGNFLENYFHWKSPAEKD